MTGLKLDAGKLRYDLIPAEQMEQIADIFTFGAEKYAPNSWQGIEDAQNRYYAALMRHLQAWRMGEIVDSESGRPHLAHVMVNAMFLANLTQK